MIIVLSDGENHEGNPLRSANDAQEAGIIIHTIGLGDVNGAEIPVYADNGRRIGAKTDAFGAMVITRLDESILRQMADTTGGIYRRATTSGDEINDILQAIQITQSAQVQTQILEQRAEQFHWFIALALVLLGIESLIPQRRKRQV